MKKTVLLVITIILGISFAGCGAGPIDDAVPTVVRVISDQVFDGDITKDTATGRLSPPVFADATQNVLLGIVFHPVTGAEISETRGFLHFTLGGTGVPPDPARITFAKIGVFVKSVQPVPVDPLMKVPFLVDLIDTGRFPAPIESTDFNITSSSTRTTFFRGADANTFVEIDITRPLQDALALGLTDFEVRFRFDRARFQTDLSTTRALVEIDNANDTPGHQRIDFAPLLHVEFI